MTTEDTTQQEAAMEVTQDMPEGQGAERTSETTTTHNEVGKPSPSYANCFFT
eukprot:m.308671 g.308671  ORF g.308671 m.308671 type:complete len:52 (+) comp15942_c1_seq5:367-522(+)